MSAPLLAAIYRDPSDDAARRSYADWLMEQGDERGELVALQLGASTAKAEARARKLLAKHGRAWAGALDSWLEPEGRAFRRGFLAEGRLSKVPPTSAFDDPAWAVLERVVLPRKGSLTREQVDALASRLKPPAALIDLAGSHAETALAHAGLACAFSGDFEPRGKRLDWSRTAWVGLPAFAVTYDWARARGVLDSARRISLQVTEASPLGAWMEGITKSAALELELVPGWWNTTGWHFALSREKPRGPFTRGEAHWRGKQSWRVVTSFSTTMRALPRGLESLTVTSDEPLKLSAAERAQLAESLSGQRKVAVQWPWEVTAPVAAGPMTRLELYGDVMNAAEIERLLAPLGVPFDAVRLRGRTVRHPKPFERLREFTAGRLESIELLAESTGEALSLRRPEHLRLDFVLRVTAEALADGVVDFVRSCSVNFCAVQDPDIGRINLPGTEHFTGLHVSGWLLLFSPAVSEWLPDAAVERVLAAPALRGAFFRRTRSQLIIATAASPSAASAKRAADLDKALMKHLGAEFARRWGYDWPADGQVAPGQAELLEPGQLARGEGPRLPPGVRRDGRDRRAGVVVDGHGHRWVLLGQGEGARPEGARARAGQGRGQVPLKGLMVLATC